MSKSPKKENRLKGLTIDELYRIDPLEMQLNGVEVEYAKKRIKEHKEDIKYKILYYKTEKEAMRKNREKYEPEINKWGALADAQGNLLTEYADLINEMLVAYKNLENRKFKILGDAKSKLRKQWEEDYKKGKAKREKQNKELNNLRRQRRPINQKYYDLNRKTNKKEENRIIFEYIEENPNGSMFNIAGITNKSRNILGMMPHPERACDKLLGSDDGKKIFQSMIGGI